jgi:hypothetical protein
MSDVKSFLPSWAFESSSVVRQPPDPRYLGPEFDTEPPPQPPEHPATQAQVRAMLNGSFSVLDPFLNKLTSEQYRIFLDYSLNLPIGHPWARDIRKAQFGRPISDGSLSDPGHLRKLVAHNFGSDVSTRFIQSLTLEQMQLLCR